jgi:enamine deaminase RidA (YjgF/YER057c/UK114 family)
VNAEARIVECGIELPAVSPPAGLYVSAVRTGDLLFLSGAGPVRADGSVVTGKVGSGVSQDEGRAAARLTGLQLLASMKAALGSLDRVSRVVKILGMVNAAQGFNRTPYVIDGCSDLFIEVFGEDGRAARSAMGMAALPFDISVEIEAIIEVRRDP